MTRAIRCEQLIGRADELKQFDRARSDAAAGSTRTLLVGGDAGIGKTRILDEWARRAADDGIRTIVGHCLQLGAASLPFGAVVDALRQLVAGVPAGRRRATFGPPQAYSALARVVPELGPADADDEIASATPIAEGQIWLFEQTAALLERAADRGPLVVAIEDLHWADQSTLDLVHYLVNALREAAIVLVLTYRSDELSRRHPLRPLLDRLQRVPTVQTITLAPLDRAELAALASAICGELPGTALLDELLARSEGNPFFAEELLAVSEGTAGPLPDRLAGVLLARVDRLPEDAQAVVRLAAAAGRDVDHELLTMLATNRLALPERRLLQALRDAVAAQVLVAADDGVGYAFRHALLQEAVHGDLLPGERVHLHAEIARILADRPELAGRAGAAGALAWHYAAAQDQPRALRASVDAARAARAATAHADEQHHLERALELWDRVPDAAATAGIERHELLLRAAAAAFNSGATHRAERYARAVIELVDERQSPVTAALAWMWLANALHTGGQPGAFDAHERAVSLLPPAPSAARARVLSSHATTLMLAPRLREATGPVEEAIAVAEQVGADGDLLHALIAAGVVRASLGDVDAGLAAFARARRLAAEKRPLSLSRIYINEADVLFHDGRIDAAVAVAQEGVRWVADRGLRRTFGTWLHGNAAEFLLHLGRLDDAGAHLDAAVATSGADVRDLHVELRRAQLALLRDDLGAAAAALAMATQVRHGYGAGAQMAGPRHELTAELALARDDPATALAAVRSGLDIVERADGVRRHGGWLYAIGLRAVAAGGGEAADASALRERLVRARATATHGVSPLWRAWTAVADAEWASASGVDATDAWHDAERGLDALGFLPAATVARIRHAETAPAEGRAAAVAAVERAWADADAAGMHLLRRQAERAGRRHHLRLGAGGEQPFGLTARELDVLRHLAEGRSNPEIGAALFISRKTVSTHVSNILAKLDVTTRGEAAAIAHRAGLGDD